MENIFISYKREQREWVAKLVSVLESYGYSVWWDPKIEVGEQYSNVINKVIAKVDCILVIWSKDSIASSWVMSEAMVGFERKNIIPILKEEITPPVPFNTIQSADLCDWNGDIDDENFQQLLSSIEKYVSLSSEPYVLNVKENDDEVVTIKTTLLSSDGDAEKWAEALSENSKIAYKEYLINYPEGKHRKKAMKKLRAFAFKKQIGLSIFILGVLTILIVVKKLGE